MRATDLNLLVVAANTVLIAMASFAGDWLWIVIGFALLLPNAYVVITDES